MSRPLLPAHPSPGDVPPGPNPPGREPTGGPTSVRSLAPDLARGAMLLLIALAHAHMHRYGDEPSGYRGYSTDGGFADRIVAGLQVLLVDGRALPMFAALFGYGLVQFADRRTAAGADWPATRTLLRRRSRWLIGFGLVHATLLFFGDILASYGLLGLLLVGMLRVRDRTLIAVAAAGTLVFALLSLGTGFTITENGSPPLPTAEANPLDAIAARLTVWAFLAPALAVDVFAPFLLGIWAARRRLLDQPGQHLRLLRRAALVGLAVAVVGGAPLALIDAQVWTGWGDGVAISAYAVHGVSGIAGGLGYAALAGLLAHHLAGRRNPVATALAATGQRSLTCYLLQSVAFVAIFAPFTAGLGGSLGDAGASAVGVAVWLTTVLLAETMRRAGRRGPAETLLRRLTYRTSR
ncbi:DUF418 domain-containing protein [Micromonospora sp. NPDC049374]|uniref:DUF418 domain-containing protein n=1 Tax=Micromonospora sp. NPDC049374 TaxID=3154352 RepID=UPI00343B4F39